MNAPRADRVKARMLAWVAARPRLAALGPALARLARRREQPPGPVLMDFAGPQRSPSRPGVLALAAGTAVLCVSIGYSEDIREEVAALEAELTSLDGQGREERLRQAARGARRPGELDDRVRKANAVIQHLALPWDSLFAALEQASGEGVALLSLEPDPARAQLRATAEARSPSAMLDYLGLLGQSAVLPNPMIVNHQVMVEDPQKPIRFSFTSTWRLPASANE